MRLLGPFAALAAALLAGCETGPVATSPAVAAQSTATAPTFPSAGATFLHWDKGHGYQVAFYGDGDIWLWYPGNTVALRGEWMQEYAAGQHYLCFTYPRSSYNPVTGVPGGQKQCQPQAILAGALKGAIAGDAFGLATGKVPYVLRRNQRPERF